MSEIQKDPQPKTGKQFLSEYANLITSVLLLIGVLLTALSIIIIKKEDRTFINILSVIGTMASIFGLSIAFIQIIALKEISVVTQRTIQLTKDKLILGLSISDVSEAIEMIREIESNIGLQKYEIAWVRIKDLKVKLIQFMTSEEFKKIVPERRIKETIDFLSIQSTRLYLIVYSEEGEAKYDPEPINRSLQEISTQLNDFKSRIKYNTV